MKKYTQVRKKLVIGIIALFLSMTFIPITGSLPIEKELSIMTKGCSDGIILNGTMGQNNWYISPVTITFVDDNNRTFIQIDGGDWFEYTVPIVVSSEGLHIVRWYYVDQWGNQSPVSSVTFKIDMTPPMITLTIERIGIFEIEFYATVSDNTSGVWYVEYYSDDVLIGTDITPPYVFVWVVTVFEKHTGKVIAYDIAGLNASSTMSSSYDLCHIQSRFLHQQIIRIFQNLLLRHQFLVRQIWN